MMIYKEEDIRVPSHPGRVRVMKTFFGSEEPTEGSLLTATFAQITSTDASLVSFRASDTLRIFLSDVDWIGDEEMLKRLLAGAIKACPELGANSVRIETAYRYCYQSTYYAEIQGVNSYLRSVGNHSVVTRGEKYGLILERFGKYHWDEEPQ